MKLPELTEGKSMFVFMQEVVDYLKAIRPLESPSIAIDQTADGYCLNAKQRNSGGLGKGGVSHG